MDSSTGGRWLFSSSLSPVILGINNGAAPVFPSPQANAFNIEVFTNPTVRGVPVPDGGFQTSITDPGGTLENGFLTGTNLVLGAGDFLVVDSVTSSSSQASQINLGGGNQTVIGAPQDTLIGGSGNQILSGLVPGMPLAIGAGLTITGGTGNESIWAGSSNLIVAGTGASQQIVISGVATTVFAGRSGNATISVGNVSTTVNSLPGSTQNLVIAAGPGNLVNLAGNSGLDAVIGAAADTITGGGGITNVEGGVGGMIIQAGAAGQTNVSGSTGLMADTIRGGSGNLNFNPGPVAGTGDLIDLTAETGQSTINTFSFGPTRVAAPDTILAGSGNDSVFAGAGDIVGMTRLAATVGGSHQWVHADTVAGSAVGFGTFDSVAGTSSAQVTVGSFDTTTDFVFYSNENQTTTSAILATSQATTVGGLASSVITLPDGTAMTLVGVTQAQLTPGLFKP
jgi:hypothetical protein